MRPAHPCACCGEPTRCFVHHETEEGGPRGISICAECLSIWQWNRQARQLLLSTRGCWGGSIIRHLLRPMQDEAPEEPAPAPEARARVGSGRPHASRLA